MRRGRILLAALLLSVASAEAADFTPGYRPLADTAEGGLWMLGDEAEKNIQQSPLVVRDEALNTYVRDLVCRLAGEHCASVRVYVVDVPAFNAAAYPNGMVLVFTGLLLRAQNEAQLAFVLGHELTHYTHRHSLKGYESARDTANVLSFFSLGTAAAGVGLVGSVATLAATGAIFSYGRDQEREADDGGFDIAVAHGYDPRQGAAIWSQVTEEEEANAKRRKPSPFFATHPSPKERIDNLSKRASDLQAQTQASELGAERYRSAIQPFRAQWLRQELDRGQFDESLVVINQLARLDPSSAELKFFLGEAYRRRNADGDLDAARRAYEDALANGQAPSATYRSLGLVAMKADDKSGARDAFTHYLALEPAADDRAMIELYLTQL